MNFIALASMGSVNEGTYIDCL